MLDLFNDIKIAKYDDNGAITKYVTVPLKYVPKQKFYTGSNDRKHEKRFPMMGLEMTDIQYAEDRVSGKGNNIVVSATDASTSFHQNGVPYNLMFDLHVTTNYLSEMDQIAEQILPFFSPHVVTKVSLDGIDLTGDMKVVMETAGVDQSPDIEESDLRKIHGIFNMRAQTFLFRDTDTTANIQKISQKYYLTDESFAKIDTTTDTVSGGGSEDFEGLVIGGKDADNEILTRYERF